MMMEFLEMKTLVDESQFERKQKLKKLRSETGPRYGSVTES